MKFTTESGSQYEIQQREDGRWWFRGVNVPSSTSVKLDNQWWEIETPAPIVTGEQVYVVSRYFHYPKDHPLRIMGGGKHTSVVTNIEEIVS